MDITENPKSRLTSNLRNIFFPWPQMCCLYRALCNFHESCWTTLHFFQDTLALAIFRVLFKKDSFFFFFPVSVSDLVIVFMAYQSSMKCSDSMSTKCQILEERFYDCYCDWLFIWIFLLPAAPWMLCQERWKL